MMTSCPTIWISRTKRIFGQNFISPLLKNEIGHNNSSLIFDCYRPANSLTKLSTFSALNMEPGVDIATKTTKNRRWLTRRIQESSGSSTSGKTMLDEEGGKDTSENIFEYLATFLFFSHLSHISFIFGLWLSHGLTEWIRLVENLLQKLLSLRRHLCTIFTYLYTFKGSFETRWAQLIPRPHWRPVWSTVHPRTPFRQPRPSSTRTWRPTGPNRVPRVTISSKTQNWCLKIEKSTVTIKVRNYKIFVTLRNFSY